MKRISIAVLAVLVTATAAFADSKPSADEITKIEAALKVWGCGKYESLEKEDRPNIAYEVDDAECNGGQYDVKLDKDYKMTSMTRD